MPQRDKLHIKQSSLCLLSEQEGVFLSEINLCLPGICHPLNAKFPSVSLSAAAARVQSWHSGDVHCLLDGRGHDDDDDDDCGGTTLPPSVIQSMPPSSV